MNHSFGGDWTEDKLNRVTKYLQAYLTALKDQPFRKIYFDAFAGTGYREKKSDSSRGLLFDFYEGEVDTIAKGSATRALELETPFDEYHLVDIEPAHYNKLTELKEKYPNLSQRIFPILGNANEEIVKFCNNMQTNERAVVFLDPYALEVPWETIEIISKTQKIDLWLLAPIGSINRMLVSSRAIPQSWKNRLNKVFGTDEWESEFYQENSQTSLFEQDTHPLKSVSSFDVEKFMVNRLKLLFPGVANNPLQLFNSKNSHIFSLFFMASNKRGAKVALNIAQHILKN